MKPAHSTTGHRIHKKTTRRFFRLIAAGFLIAMIFTGCAGTGMKATHFPLEKLPQLKAGDRLPKPLVQPSFEPGQRVVLRSHLRTLSRFTIGELFFAPVTLNGVEADLLIDTGAPVTGIGADLARRAHVPVSKVAGHGDFTYDPALAGKTNVAWGRVDEFFLKSLLMPDAAILVADRSYAYHVVGIPLVRAHDVLGMDILRAFACTFDFTRHECVLVAGGILPTATQTVIPLILEKPGTLEFRPNITLRIQGHETSALLDSGATGKGVLGASLWTHLGLSGDEARLDISVGELVLRGVIMRRSQSEFSMLPLDALKPHARTVTMDFPNKRVLLGN